MRRLILLLTLIATPFAASSSALIPGPVLADYITAYDGDTFTARAWIWPRQSVEAAIRVRGIDTPEIRGHCLEEKRAAAAARDHAQRLLQAAIRIELLEIIDDKYGGRVAAHVRIDGVDFAELMLAAGHARPYDGNVKHRWCP
ncbi:thermonuclease family protein [Oceanibaculum nanhaiense]|uniref:thermonuclease family protein n=1 Tax=Oceanibaculum nanhaiense TaxID=1909734 RepID=UPI003D2A9559